MERIAFKMKIFAGCVDEYKRRHDEIWPELVKLLKEAGLSKYSIFIDEETNSLFCILEAEHPKALDDLPKHEIMQQWWKFMSDIMETNIDHSPVSTPLKELFYLP